MSKKKKYYKKADCFCYDPSDNYMPTQSAKGISLAIQGENIVGIPQGREGHIIIFGGSGSGKSTGPIMATLNTWDGPIVATDPKGELYSYYKDLYENRIVTREPILFDPSSEDTVKYDPYQPLRKNESDLMGNCIALARAISPIPPDCREPYWAETKHALIASGILFYYQQNYSFGETLMALTAIPLKETLDLLNNSLDAKIKIIIGSMSKLKEKEIAIHDRELRNELSLLAADNRITDVFSCNWDKDKNCFCWGDLNTHNFFIRIPEERMEQWSAPLRLMVTQLFDHLMRRPDRFSSEHEPPVLLLLDEFPRFGKIEGMTNALCTLRSKNVNIVLAVQSLAQMDKHYGVENRRIICDNCQHKVILQACDKETQDYLSDLIGVHLVKLHSRGQNFDIDYSILSYSKQKSESYQPIIFPHELSSLNDAILLSPFGNYRLKKINVYDPWFEQKLESELLSTNSLEQDF